MTPDQQAFLKELAQRIPQLFELIRQGNIKSEFILGVRRIGQRDVRLKLVAEVVDPGINPLQSHGTMSNKRSSEAQNFRDHNQPAAARPAASLRRSARRKSRR